MALSGTQAETETPYTSGADLIVANWTRSLPATFHKLALLPEDEFIQAWQGEHDRWVAMLRQVDGYNLAAIEAERYEARIFYEWALGRLYYPSAHRALANASDYQPSDNYDSYLDQLDLGRADLLDLDEYTRFLVLVRNQASNALKAEMGEAINNGTRDLTSRRLANKQFHPAVQCFLEREALEFWLEDFDADGLTNEVVELEENCPGPETDAIVDVFNAEIAERDGHIIEIFKSVDGHELEMHIYVPDGIEEPAPATVWIHGGGWRTGSWSWCGPCVWMKERGHVVAQVEYRLAGRHGTGIEDALVDTFDAIAWMRANADRFGADPDRIVESGFSAGGHLSLAATTFADGEARPDLVVAISPCTDLTNDGYTIGLSGSYPAARAMSPRFHVRSDMAPIFMASADEDTDCSFEASSEFVRSVEDSGGTISFVEQYGAGHFFLREPERAAETKAAIEAFFDENGY